MFKSKALRQSARFISAPRNVRSTISTRPFSLSTVRYNDEKKAPPGASGAFSQTNDNIKIEHPGDKDHPESKPIGGKGGTHSRLTLPSFSLEGGVGVITGGARGLGLVMAQALVISGADVALVDLNNKEGEKRAVDLVEEFKANNPGVERTPKITAHYCDVADPASVDTCFKEIVGQHGKVDHLVTSAGFTENFEASQYPPDRMRKLWGVNVDGTYLWAAALARHLMERKAPGSMVMVGSMSGAVVNVPQPQAPYNASKAAVRQLAASMAVEWAPYGIRVNCISPGYMLTALTKKILDENPDLKKKWISLIPQGKMGDPVDLMGAVVYLLSSASNYVTGSDLRIDGGYTVA